MAKESRKTVKFNSSFNPEMISRFLDGRLFDSGLNTPLKSVRLHSTIDDKIFSTILLNFYPHCNSVTCSAEYATPLPKDYAKEHDSYFNIKNVKKVEFRVYNDNSRNVLFLKEPDGNLIIWKRFSKEGEWCGDKFIHSYSLFSIHYGDIKVI